MEKQIGPESKLAASIVNGKIQLSVVYDGAQVDGEVKISTDSDMLVDALLGLIPGDSSFEVAMGALLKAALKSVTV